MYFVYTRDDMMETIPITHTLVKTSKLSSKWGSNLRRPLMVFNSTNWRQPRMVLECLWVWLKPNHSNLEVLWLCFQEGLDSFRKPSVRQLEIANTFFLVSMHFFNDALGYQQKIDRIPQLPDCWWTFPNWSYILGVPHFILHMSYFMGCNIQVVIHIHHILHL